MKIRFDDKLIKELEKKYGRHKFCYECGNPDIKPIDDFPFLFWCPKCGSSDLDE